MLGVLRCAAGRDGWIVKSRGGERCECLGLMKMVAPLPGRAKPPVLSFSPDVGKDETMPVNRSMLVSGVLMMGVCGLFGMHPASAGVYEVAPQGEYARIDTRFLEM
ncbi:hypothetical protein [Chromobacterium sphagni]|uniref:hypothetical protein n=1 Tax=Chromobacterium sphagni TaxID=1903179 RepID=UPI0019D3D860|nr:hypothetical protein [Chromobacterium sphagni]